MASLRAPPSPSQNPVSSLLARFEYEAGRTSVADATKVLMVEWEEPAEQLSHTAGQGRRPDGDWVIEWKGRREILKATDSALEDDSAKRNAMGSSVVDSQHLTFDEPKAEGSTRTRSRSRGSSQSDRAKTHRLYFLLAPGAAVPPTVSVTYKPNDSTSLTQMQKTPTLPAIFSEPLLRSATSPSSGKKGVLHTLWAKARIGALKAEIAAEERERLEGIGLEMAKEELEWISENFGVGHNMVVHDDMGNGQRKGDETSEEIAKGQHQRSSVAADAMNQTKVQPSSPLTPNSPSSSNRLLSKMAGLRVGTSPTASAPPAHFGIQTPPNTKEIEGDAEAGKNPLSPEEGDVAVGAFAAIRGSRSNVPTSASHAANNTAAPTNTHAPTKIPAPILPPHSTGGSGGISALGDVLGGPGPQFEKMKKDAPAQAEDHEDESEGLFAVAMSPRSPETKTSPFSFAR